MGTIENKRNIRLVAYLRKRFILDRTETYWLITDEELLRDSKGSFARVAAELSLLREDIRIGLDEAAIYFCRKWKGRKNGNH